MSGRLPVEPIFDRTPHPFGNGLVDPVVYDASAASLRQRTVNFAAKRYADMMFVSGLSRATADKHFRLRAALVPGGLDGRPVCLNLQAEVQAAFAAGHINIETDPADRRATARWNDSRFPASVIGSAVARPGYGGIVLGEHAVPQFDPKPIARHLPSAGQAWPRGEVVDGHVAAPPALAEAFEGFFTSSPGVYGVLIATPDRALQRVRTRRSCDPKLVDDQGDHLHLARPADS